MTSKKYNIFELFSGAGGLSLGFTMSGKFKIIAANEILKDAGLAYQMNHPDTKVLIKDIRDLSESEILSILQENINNIDVVIGGPPCQAYSTAGKRLMSDPRAELFQEYIRVLKILSPKVFVFENVKGLLSMQNGKLFPRIIEEFENLGYSTTYKILNSADFGVPQQRERVIIVGTKLKKAFEFPSPTHRNPDLPHDMFTAKLPVYVTLGEAIGDLPHLNNNDKEETYLSDPQNEYQAFMRSEVKGKLTEHSSPNNSEWLQKIMATLPEGGSPKDLPDDLKPKSGFGNSYCRLWWNKPSTTITRNLGTPSSARCIHPKDARPLSTREGARLQSFPDNYKFYGSRGAKNLQIGEAVPPLLAYALAKKLGEYLDCAH